MSEHYGLELGRADGRGSARDDEGYVATPGGLDVTTGEHDELDGTYVDLPGDWDDEIRARIAADRRPLPAVRTIVLAGGWSARSVELVGEGAPVELAGEGSDRRAVEVRNRGPVPVRIAPHPAPYGGATGLEVAPGAVVRVETSRAVYGAAGPPLAGATRDVVLVARQTLAGNAITLPAVTLLPGTRLVAHVLRVWAMAGTTTPTVRGLFYPVTGDQWTVGARDLTTAVSTVTGVGGIAGSYATEGEDGVNARVNTTGGSADAVTEVELVARLIGTPAGSGAAVDVVETLGGS